MTQEMKEQVSEIQKDTWLYCGEGYQRLLWCEELGELTQAISKEFREPSPAKEDNLIEEMADVYIILQEMQNFFHVSDEDIKYYQEKKIKRTLERLSDIKCKKILEKLA